MRGRAAGLLVALLVSVVAACGDDGGADDAEGDAGETTSTVLTTTTTSAPGVSSDTEPPGPDDLPPRSATGPSGSGCAPGDGELPDGWWYGVSVGFNPGPDPSFTFDLACYFSGEAAYAEGERLGLDVSNDVLVTNENPVLRTVALAAGAAARCADLSTGNLVEAPCDPTTIPDPDQPWAVWFEVQDGELVRLVEQYAP